MRVKGFTYWERPSSSETRRSSSSTYVRAVEGVVELVPLEDVVVRPRLVAGAVLWVDRPPNGPDRALAPLDPDHDPFLGAVVHARDPALSESSRRRSSPDPITIKPVGRLSQFFRNPFAFLFERSSQEDRLAAYVIGSTTVVVRSTRS